MNTVDAYARIRNALLENCPSVVTDSRLRDTLVSVAGNPGKLVRARLVLAAAVRHGLVFERNVSDLFFSSVTTEQVGAIRALPQVEAAHPLLFGIVSAADSPVVTCFGIEADDPRLVHGDWRGGRVGHVRKKAGRGVSRDACGGVSSRETRGAGGDRAGHV
jgi:hypothetical protein